MSNRILGLTLSPIILQTLIILNHDWEIFLIAPKKVQRQEMLK